MIAFYLGRMIKRDAPAVPLADCYEILLANMVRVDLNPGPMVLDTEMLFM